MKTVWVNGCFDVLHRGHMELFEFAKSKGDFLVVGIDCDERVKKNKGSSRPINNESDRKYFLECIKFIDKVVGKPIFKCNGFYETDYVKNRNRKVKAVYDIERKKEDVIENMHKNASKAFPKNDIKPVPRGKMSNMSAEKQVLDNTDPLMGPIIKRKSGKLDKL